MAEISEALPHRSAFAVPFDSRHPLADKLPKLTIGKDWLDVFFGFQSRQEASPQRFDFVRLPSGQEAAIATTPLTIGTQPAGLWRVSWQVRVTQPATTSSSVQLVLTWNQGGVAQLLTLAAVTGNNTVSRAGAVEVFHADEASPISYSTVYSSVGATPMQYELDVHAEQIGLNP